MVSSSSQQIPSSEEILEGEIAPISQSLKACFQKYDAFLNDTREARKAQRGGLAMRAWEDEMGRLRMWAANIGAHRRGQSSLDFRLRDSSHIRLRIIRLLEVLLRTLQDAQDVISGCQSEEPLDEYDDLSIEEKSQSDLNPQSELEVLEETFAKMINCLFQMSMLVRRPAKFDLQVRSKNIDVSAFQQFDINHVRNKFPEAEEVLVSRLGGALTRRRRYLKYRERHAAKLKQDLEKFAGDQDQAYSAVLSDTVATTFEEWDLNTNDDDDAVSESDISQTSYASTLLTGGTITVPSPPKASEEGAPFECPYCFFVITIKSTRAWYSHVFHDLQPYTCVDRACITPEQIFTTRHEWLAHFSAAHVDNPLNEQRWQSINKATCPLCKECIKSSKSLARHVARHLQELALFVLPRSDEESDASEGEGDDLSQSDDDSSGNSGSLEGSADAVSPTQSDPERQTPTLRSMALKGLEEKDERGLLNEKEKTQYLQAKAKSGRVPSTKSTAHQTFSS